MDREQFRKAGYAAIDRVCDYFDELADLNVMPASAPGDTARLIATEAPVDPENWDVISGDFDRVILPGITHWQHPSFFAYFPANTTYESILADIYVGAVSNPGFNWLCSPACTELEVVMMDWVGKMLGLDKSFWNESGVGGGIIMGSASESCLTVCVAARERALKLLPETKKENMIIYGTTQTHSVGAKAALILGFEFRAIETFEKDDWGLRGDGLRKALEEGKKEGKLGFIFLATLGSTSTGAIDYISEITAVAADYPELFIHLDAAWAGVFLALPELREECQLDAINARSIHHITLENTLEEICKSGEVHSICTNLHKSGLVTFDASCLWIRDRKLLTEALDVTPPFLRNKQSESGAVIDYRNWQLPLGRRFRSLKVYFVLRSYGISGFQNHLRTLNTLAEQLVTLLYSDPTHFTLFVPRRLSLVVFRLTLAGASDDTLERLNKDFFRRTTERHDIHLTPTTVGGKYCTRVAVGSQETKEEHIEGLWKVIRELAEEARVAMLEEEMSKVVIQN